MIKVKLMKSSSLLKEAGYTLHDEVDIYNRQLDDILENTRWYLDNAYKLPEYQLRYVNYSSVNISPTAPKRIKLINKNVVTL